MSERNALTWNQDDAPLNNGEKYYRAMKITDQAEADRYFEALVQINMHRSGLRREDAEAIERMNLGYFAGYFNGETQARVNRLYRTEHPVYGGNPFAR